MRVTNFDPATPVVGAKKGQRLTVVDTTNLIDADWAAIDRVNRACEIGGADAFWGELEKLDVAAQLRVMGAFFPELLREVIEEEMAADVTDPDCRAGP